MLSFKEYFIKLNEDYKSSEKRFLDQGANKDEVSAAIEFHKKWKNTFKPEWKDIDKIQNWKDFKNFIEDRKSLQKTKETIKKEQDQVILRDDDEWFIVIPLDHKTSCYHGSDTDWCTTKAEHEYFSKYFFDAKIVLVYCIKKNQAKDKWAVALHPDHISKSEFFTKRDRPLHQSEFESQTGLKFKDIENGVVANLNYIENKREENKKNDLNYLLKKAIKKNKPNKDLENLIISTKNLRAAYEYARGVLGGPFPKGEDAIAKDPEWAYNYAADVIGGPFPKGEDAIAKDPELAYGYAYVIKEPFSKGEDAIAKDPKLAYQYADEVIGGPFPKGEDAIAKDPEWAYQYARYVLKDKDPETWAKRHLASKKEK